MKKSMAVILAAVTAVTLTACGGSGTAGNTQNDTQNQSSEAGAGASSSGNTDMVLTRFIRRITPLPQSLRF